MKDKSNIQEHLWADKVGGNVTMGSGNLWFQKGDVNAPNWKFELKTTEKEYYNLHLKDLNFCLTSAYAAYKNPAFVIQFDNKNNLENIIIMPLSDYEGGINISELQILEIKKKQLKIKQSEVEEKILLLKTPKRKYLIFPEEFFIENIL